MEKNESPYRGSTPFLEKGDLEDVEKRLEKKISNLGFVWAVVAVIFMSILVSFYSSAERMIVHQRSHYHHILNQQEKVVDQFQRYDYILRQQRSAASCANMCISILSVDFKTASEHDLDVRDDCFSCLTQVAAPMPFDVAYPLCSITRR